MTRLRCAIYTRKSSEEGLEQSFNSLDAQREACEAYVLSQKSEGWKALPAKYDDGGFSGGKMERPALQRLLQDIAAGRVDVVVVYKVDRLTRSLADFAKIVEVFDRYGVSFVSVTQAFNTTSSMGRLTLNVLLSFAQFEREVTSERIRDKIAASKAKGMWMGGCPPLGYTMLDRKLIVVPDEAATVQRIFAGYLSLGSVNALADQLEAAGVHSKVHVARNGRTRGGTPFSRGALFHLLRNRLYLGEIVHKGTVHPGLHDPIISPELFEQVQKQLAANTVRRRVRRTETAPLTGLVFDAVGRRMSPSHSIGRYRGRYRYYVSPDRPRTLLGSDRDQIGRVSGPALEELVADRLRSILNKPQATWVDLRTHLARVEVRATSVTLQLVGLDASALNIPAGAAVDRFAGVIRCTIPACMQPRRGSGSVTAPAAGLARSHHDRPLIAALRRAHRELARCELHFSGRTLNMVDARGIDDPYLRSLTRLAFLAPDIQQAILTGRQPPSLSLKWLLDADLPVCWTQQRVQLGFGAGPGSLGVRAEGQDEARRSRPSESCRQLDHRR